MLIVLLIAIQAGVGAWIGSVKGNTSLGLLLGLLLGVIGWGIMAFVPKSRDKQIAQQVQRNQITTAAAGRPLADTNLLSIVNDMTSAERRTYIKSGAVPFRFHGQE